MGTTKSSSSMHSVFASIRKQLEFIFDINTEDSEYADQWLTQNQQSTPCKPCKPTPLHCGKS